METKGTSASKQNQHSSVAFEDSALQVSASYVNKTTDGNVSETGLALNASVDQNAVVDFSHHGFNTSDSTLIRPIRNFSMELDKRYIEDYEEYKSVLNQCSTTLHTTPYPDDGELNPSSFQLFPFSVIFYPSCTHFNKVSNISL